MANKTLLFCAALIAIKSSFAHAQEQSAESFWQIQTSAYTHHFSYNPDHNNHQKLLNIEYNTPSRWLVGGATFRNSFGQASQYAYVGKRFDLAKTPLYLKLSAGLLHGYKGEYQNKIPFNHYGVAPAIIPALGLHAGPVTTEVSLLGTSAVMLNVGFRL